MTRGGCACGHLGPSLVFVPKIDAARRQKSRAKQWSGSNRRSTTFASGRGWIGEWMST